MTRFCRRSRLQSIVFALRYLFVPILLCIIIAIGLPVLSDANSIISPKQATPKGELATIAPDAFEFQPSDTRYIIDSNGKGVRFEPNGEQLGFIIPLEEFFYIEKLYFLEIDDGLVIIYENSDSEVGAADIVRLKLTDLEMVWDNHIPGFNIGEPIVKDNSIYLSAIGFIAKLDLNDGRYLWKYSDLYKKTPGIFNSFLKPAIKDNLILFTEIVPLKRSNPATIVVNDETGEIISPW